MVTELNDSSFKVQVEGTAGAAVVDFSASWCGPCRALAPLFDKLSETYEGKIRFYKMDIDECQETALQFSIMSVPSIVLFKDGKAIDMSVGLKSESALAQFVEKAL